MFFKDAKDGAHANIAIDVGTSVEWIKGDAEFATFFGGDNDRFFILFTDQYGTDSAVDECVDHHVVGHDIEFLLIIAGGVDFACEAVELGYAGAGDGGGD